MDDRYNESKRTQEMLGLSDPITRDICVQRNMKIPMRDGVLLNADYWAPASGGDGLPVALIRSPYKHLGGIEDILIKPLVERGFQGVVCSVRGLQGSEGEFSILEVDREDGLDTIEWIIHQPWFGESIIMHGPSYQGLVQWALAGKLPPQVKMLIPSESSANMSDKFLNKHPFALEGILGWGMYMKYQEEDDPVAAWMEVCEDVCKAFWHLPLSDIDKVGTGDHFHIAQKLLRTEPGKGYADGIETMRVPMCMIAGWHDVFIEDQLRNFETMQNAGCPVYITIGEWPHYDPEMTALPVREALTYGLPVALGQAMPQRPKVKMYVMGAEEWREYDQWPPMGYEDSRFYLQADGQLETGVPAASEPDQYRYDPSDPTPAVGGKRLHQLPGVEAGRAVQTELEARKDVLTYTTSALEQDMEMIGYPRAEVWFSSSLQYADVFVKICDVDAGGVSTYVCDGIISLNDANETNSVKLTLNPTAYLFKAGHRIRVQISSGAFPEYARNMGTGEYLADAVKMVAADQNVYHDSDHLSAVVLPLKEIIS